MDVVSNLVYVSPQYRSELYILLHLLLVLVFCRSLEIPDDEIAVSLASFQLSHTPGRVVNHVTKNVKVRCAHKNGRTGNLQAVTKIRILKKPTEHSPWQVLAELRDDLVEASTQFDILVSGVIGQNLVDTFLEVTWSVSVDETFGFYKCHVIGFPRNSAQLLTEMTATIVILSENVNNSDVFLLFKEIDQELCDAQIKAVELNETMSSTREVYMPLTSEFESQSEQFGTLLKQAGSIEMSVDSTTEELLAVNGEVSSLALGINLINDTLTTTTKKIADLEENVSSIEGVVKRIQENADTGIEEVTTLYDDTKSLQGSLKSLKTEVIYLEQGLSSSEERLDLITHDSETAKEDAANLKSEVGGISSDMSSIRSELQGVQGQFSSLRNSITGSKYSQDVIDALHAWPEGQFALLRPATGCPVDLTFSGQRDVHFRIHTKSSQGDNKHSYPDFLGHWIKSKIDSNEYLNLWFCEANGVFNAETWPEGSYCINKIDQIPCPAGFESGEVGLSVENGAPAEATYSSNTDGYAVLEFCCRDDGRPSDYISLPTSSPFLLYRRGDECQKVKDMIVSEETIPIDTGNMDTEEGSIPEISMPSTIEPLKMFICYYLRT